jgi:hypothetical protein
MKSAVASFRVKSMGSNNLLLNVPCMCGRSLAVNSTQAGAKVSCECGKEIQLPSLSQMRKLAGQDAYATNPADKIKRSLKDGINPSGNTCLCCNSLHPLRFELSAECEQMVVKGQGDPTSIPSLFAKFAAILFLPRFLLLLMGSGGPTNEPDVMGHDVSVDFPLMVCDACVKSGQDPRRNAVAKKLMQKVPVYQELLSFYPDLKLSSH